MKRNIMQRYQAYFIIRNTYKAGHYMTVRYHQRSQGITELIWDGTTFTRGNFGMAVTLEWRTRPVVHAYNKERTRNHPSK
jgi:hypothetical protein